MQQSLEVLGLLAEITSAFVAFAVIVASIRVCLGQQLASFQLLLVHFFTESGMIVVTACLFLIILGEFLDDEALIANASTWYPLLALTLYLLTYLRRRRAINASTPLLSLMDIIMWAVWLIILIITLTEIFWSPSLAIVMGFYFWGLVSATVIFVSFLSSFLISGKTELG
jgi:hypothetical protein